MMAKKKIVIVGAGMAGLTAAAYLTRANYEVLLLDKNDRCGGLVNTFEVEDFSFDAGPRAFVNSGMVKPILKDLGISWEFLDNKISIAIEDEIVPIESMDSIREYERILCNLYPESRGEIEKIISVISQLSGYTEILYEFDNPNFVDFKNNRIQLFKKLIPWTIKFLFALGKMNQFKMPMEDFLQGLTKNQPLIDVLTQMFFRKTPTDFALGYFYVYLDYFYPLGGTGSLPNLLKEKVLEGGGEIQLNKEIVKIKPSESLLVDSNGSRYPYDQLIWAADLKNLYRYLDLQGLDESTISAIESKQQSILSAKGAESVYIMYLAADRAPAYFQARGGEHLFFTPSRKGLGETDYKDRLELIAEFDQRTKEEIFDWMDRFLTLNTFEISLPVLRDPTLAPEGKTGILISFLFDYNLIEKIEKSGWYDEFKEFVENRIVSILSETLYEGLENDLLFKFSATPLTINRISGSSEGAITGWSFETEVPVFNKLKDIPNSVLTPIPGVLKAGQWAYAPAGVPIAMLTGWYATQVIVKS